MRDERGFLGSGAFPYVKIGQGPVVVIFDPLRVDHCPLIGPSLDGFKNTFADFAQDFTLVHLGRRKALPEGCTMAHLAQEMGQSLESEFPQGVHILGTGVGAGIGVHLAAEFPRLVKSVVTYSWGPRLSSLGQALYQELLDLSREEKWARVHQAMARWMFRKPWSQALGSLTALIFAEDLGKPDSPWDFQVMIQSELAQDSRYLGPLLTPPILSFLGAQDPLYEAQDLQAFVSSNPNGTVEILPKTAHGVGKVLNNRVWDRTFDFFRSSGGFNG